MEEAVYSFDKGVQISVEEHAPQIYCVLSIPYQRLSLIMFSQADVPHKELMRVI